VSIDKFAAVIQSQIYKNWLEKMSGRNIINTGTKALRSSQELSTKTDFYITAKDIALMYKTITGKSLEEAGLRADNILRDLQVGDADPTVKGAVIGKSITVEKVDGLLFSQIGFKTISTRLNSVFNELKGVTEAYKEAEETFEKDEMKLLKKSPEYLALEGREGLSKRREMENKVREKAKERATLGYYFNKGHVVGVATNLTKEFRNTLEQSYDKAIKAGDKAAESAKQDILSVLDAYIEKLEQDDLATANLAKSSIDIEFYARYIKDSTRYLVEMQLRVRNQVAGSNVAPIVNELTSIFSGKLSETELKNVLGSSPQLGQALLISPGSPSMLSLIATDIVNAIKGVTAKTPKYSIPKTKIASNKIKVISGDRGSNKKKIAELSKLKQKIKSSKKERTVVKTNASEKTLELNLSNLQNLLNNNLVRQVKANMGTGSSKAVLNLRTGRFAESVKVERVSESKAGMITAFYSYMKNPYATFSQGGAQSQPASRDPKLLIAKSIREIASQQVANRLRSVAI
jgi:hypothetical protein